MSSQRKISDAFKYLTRYLPVNKRYDEKQNSVKLPQLRNPVVLGTIGLGATATTALHRLMRRRPRHQLAAMFEDALENSELVERALVRIQDSMASRRLHVQIQAVEGVGEAQAVELAKEVLELAWNAPKLGPVAVMVEVRTADKAIVNAATLGFESDVAYPHELYERFGPPASDPDWLP